MEGKIELCVVKFSSSYEIPLGIVKEFETESVTKGFHAYMDDCIPNLAENLSAPLETAIKLINMMWLLLMSHRWLTT